MVMKNNGNVRFLALFASKPHIFMYGALKLSGIVRANFRLNIAIAMLFLSLTRVDQLLSNSVYKILSYHEHVQNLAG